MSMRAYVCLAVVIVFMLTLPRARGATKEEPRSNGLTSTLIPDWRTRIPPTIYLLRSVCPETQQGARLQWREYDMRAEADETTAMLYNMQCKCPEYNNNAQKLAYFCESADGKHEVVVIDSFFIRVLICSSWCGVQQY